MATIRPARIPEVVDAEGGLNFWEADAVTPVAIEKVQYPTNVSRLFFSAYMAISPVPAQPVANQEEESAVEGSGYSISKE
jgi:hypothetical protein